MKILIVDDSRAMRAIVRRAVLGSGLELLEIETAESGQEALSRVQNFQPDLVLTDWHMPGMSGLEMVQNMRQRGLNDIHVGFITTESQNSRMDEALRTGADFFLNKPFKDEELRDLLMTVAQKIASAPAPLKPIALTALTSLVRSTVNEIPFRLVEQDMTPAHLTAENLLALYRSESTKSLVAVAVMDIHCVTMVGAGKMAFQPATVKPYMDSGKPSPEMQAHAGTFLGSAASFMKAPVDGAITMLKQSMVTSDFAKLQELFKQNRGCSYFRLDIPGYGSGRMGFLLV